MSLSRDSRQERKMKAIRRAQFALKQRFERIDWEEDILLPEVEALKSGRSVLGLAENTAFTIEVMDEDSRSSASPEQSESTTRRGSYYFADPPTATTNP